jgi:hypothetical protein
MIKIQTNEKQYGSTSDDYLEMLRRIYTYPGINQITTVIGKDTIIEFNEATGAEMFLAFEGPERFTRIL